MNEKIVTGSDGRFAEGANICDVHGLRGSLSIANGGCGTIDDSNRGPSRIASARGEARGDETNSGIQVNEASVGRTSDPSNGGLASSVGFGV